MRPMPPIPRTAKPWWRTPSLRGISWSNPQSSRLPSLTRCITNSACLSRLSEGSKTEKPPVSLGFNTKKETKMGRPAKVKKPDEDFDDNVDMTKKDNQKIAAMGGNIKGLHDDIRDAYEKI